MSQSGQDVAGVPLQTHVDRRFDDVGRRFDDVKGEIRGVYHYLEDWQQAQTKTLHDVQEANSREHAQVMAKLTELGEAHAGLTGRVNRLEGREDRLDGAWTAARVLGVLVASLATIALTAAGVYAAFLA